MGITPQGPPIHRIPAGRPRVGDETVSDGHHIVEKVVTHSVAGRTSNELVVGDGDW